MTRKDIYLKIIKDLKDMYQAEITIANTLQKIEDKEYFALLGGKHALELIEELIESSEETIQQIGCIEK